MFFFQLSMIASLKIGLRLVFVDVIIANMVGSKGSNRTVAILIRLGGCPCCGRTCDFAGFVTQWPIHFHYEQYKGE